MEHDDRHAGFEAEVGDVERQLQHGLAPVQHERGDDAGEDGEDEVPRRREEQAQDQRDLVQRIGEDLAAELDVDDRYLGEREHGGERPPLQLERRMRGVEPVDHEEVQGRGGAGQGCVEQPDLLLAAQEPEAVPEPALRRDDVCQLHPSDTTFDASPAEGRRPRLPRYVPRPH
jgi:hypothetical protein